MSNRRSLSVRILQWADAPRTPNRGKPAVASPGRLSGLLAFSFPSASARHVRLIVPGTGRVTILLRRPSALYAATSPPAPATTPPSCGAACGHRARQPVPKGQEGRPPGRGDFAIHGPRFGPRVSADLV